MKYLAIPLVFLSALLIAACDSKQASLPPAPYALTAEAIGRYCGMNILEHAGPKGQVILDARIGEPIWFSSARDTLAFTMLPEEPKDYVAIYVSDMGKAPSWEQPGANNWIDATKAFYVIGSTLRSGMGADETVPFSTEDAAKSFSAKNGGRVVTFSNVPRNYVLGDAEAETSNDTAPAPAGEDTKGQDHG